MRRGLPVAAAAFHAGMGFCRFLPLLFSLGRGVLPVVAAASRAGQAFGLSPVRLSSAAPRASLCLSSAALRDSLVSVFVSGPLVRAPFPGSGAPLPLPHRRLPLRASRCVPPVACLRHPLPARARHEPRHEPGMPRHKPARRARVLPCFAVSCLPPLPRRRAGCRVLLDGVVGITSDFYRKTTIFCCFSNFYLYICIAETKRHGIWIFTLRPTNSQPFKIKSSPGSLAA